MILFEVREESINASYESRKLTEVSGCLPMEVGGTPSPLHKHTHTGSDIKLVNLV